MLRMWDKSRLGLSAAVSISLLSNSRLFLVASKYRINEYEAWRHKVLNQKNLADSSTNEPATIRPK